MLRILRDGVQILQMYEARKHGSTDSLDEAGYVCPVERGGAGFGSDGEGDRIYQFCSKLSEDNFWIMSEGDGNETRITLVNTRQRKGRTNGYIEGARTVWIIHFVKKFDLLEYR